MNILQKIGGREYWQEFFNYKVNGNHFSNEDEKHLKSFIENEEYLPVIEAIKSGAAFPHPVLHELNKKHTQKKRRVFVFERAELYVLKLIAYLLNEYDGIFPDNLYSFRRNIGVKQAVSEVLRGGQTEGLYSYKVDIHDYFNSADTDIAVCLLYEALKGDKELASFIEKILRDPYCVFGGNITEHKKGIMAGMPVSGFLANLYLKELDEWFFKRGIIYARYSDDIIVFADSPEKISLYERVIKDFFAKRKLTVNEKKEFRTSPGEEWEFLGFSVRNKEIDISEVSLEKIKAKLKRKAKALLRWKTRKGKTDENAIRAFIKFCNRKFYDNPVSNEITWCRWYFPAINTANRLHIIDEYAVSCIRFIATGKHTKANYNLRYETIKSYGYKSLVHSFYEYKKSQADGN